MDEKFSHPEGVHKGMMERLKPLLIVAASLFIAYHVAVKVAMPTFFPDEQHLVNDFGTYYAASHMIRDGGTPYRSTDGHQTMVLSPEELASWQMNKATIPAYIYPSFLAVALTPVTHLPFPQARTLWCALSAVAFLASIALTFILLGRKPRFDVPTLVVVAVFGASMPTLETFTLGQVNYIVLALLLASFAGHLRNQPVLGGASLAAASLIKVSPALLILYFLWRRDYRFLAGFAAAGALAAGMMLAAAPSADLTFLREVLPAIGARTPELNNKAVAVWWQVLFTQNDLAPPIVHQPMIASALAAATIIAVVVWLAIVFRRSESRSDLQTPAKGAVELFTCAAALLLAQPYLEIHHLVFAFPAAGCLVILWSEQKVRWGGVSLLALMFLLLNSRGENSYRWLGPHWYSAFLSTPQAYGLLLVLFFLSLLLLGKLPGSSTDPRRRSS